MVFIKYGIRIQVQRVVVHLKTQQFAHSRFDLLNARITEFEHFVTVQAYQVIVLTETVTLFVHCHVLSELMAFYQTAVQQQVERIVDRCAAYPVFAVLHVDEQRIHIKMFFMRVNFVEYGVAFRRLPLLVLFKIGRKDLSDFQLYLLDFITRALHKVQIYIEFRNGKAELSEYYERFGKNGSAQRFDV